MLKYRVIPFRCLNTGEQFYTLVEEWWTEGRFVKESRQQMAASAFNTLAQAVDDARKDNDSDLVNTELLTVATRDFNDFTTHVKSIIGQEGHCLVQLRDGSFLEIVYTPIPGNDHDEPLFHTANLQYFWEDNGKSFTSSDLDMIKIRS